MALSALPAMVYHPCYSDLALPERHRYPIEKYRYLQQQLLQLGVPATHFSCPTAITANELALAHCPAYIQSLADGSIDSKAMRRIGFPWSAQLYQRSLYSVGGTVLTAQLALQHGIALHLSGGYHHAFYAEGSGFCLFNDLVVAAKTLLAQGLDKILLFDLDVHQGDGSALLLADEPRIISCSLHCEKNFPYRKQASDWDIALAKDCNDSEYLQAVEQSLSSLLQWHQPELVLFDAGVDIHRDDELGLLNISTQALYQRDLMVFEFAKQHRIPLLFVLAGGYQALPALTELHVSTFKAAQAVYFT